MKKNEVKFAKTRRLKNSSIPYMQRILNSDNLEFENKNWKEKSNFKRSRILKRNEIIFVFSKFIFLVLVCIFILCQ